LPQYRTNHQVGRFAPDTLINDLDLQDADLGWLLRSGAIEPVGDDVPRELGEVLPQLGSEPAESVEYLEADLEAARSRVAELEQTVIDVAQKLQTAEHQVEEAGKAAAELAEQTIAQSVQIEGLDAKVEELRALIDLIIPKTASALKGLNEEQLRAIAGYRQVEDIPGTKDGIIAVLAPKE